ncbi:MAG: hypothetical protein ACAH11_13005 [Sphingomonas sp.]
MILLGIGFAALGLAAPAQAQSDPAVEIDRLVQDSQSVSSGLALARGQIAGDDLIGALGTLERVLIDHPESDDALLLHVSLLCRLDDAPGARAEMETLRGVGGSDVVWAEVRAACGPVMRPSGRN